MNFQINSDFKPSGDQPKAIKEIVDSFRSNINNQVLLGATGTGKTFTMANVIQELQKPTLILVHNKTLAMQICSEMKSFFPNNKVEYYVSYFDYYRPEAYKPHNDLYLEKRTQRNSGIEKMRMSALNSLSTENSVIVVASVASIYGCINPNRYKTAIIKLKIDDTIIKEELLTDLDIIGYNTEKKNLKISENEKTIKFSIDREEDSFFVITVSQTSNKIIKLEKLWKESSNLNSEIKLISIPPIQYIVEKDEKMEEILKKIKDDLKIQKLFLKSEGKFLESKRLEKRIGDDLLDFKEFGFCSGIENYSLYFDGRKTGDSPFVLFDFFPLDDFITIIDESHITIPQIKAMYNTDKSRKKTLVDYGFRLPSAMDNRPLNFDEFLGKLNKTLYVSATPGNFELEKVENKITEQIIRPTWLLDPKIEVRSSINQIKDIIEQIKIRIKSNEKVLIYALTINMSEDISSYLQEQGIKAVFIHSRMNVFERYQAISSLRRGIYDVIVGINLLKEGIDIPEVSLVCIIDADKPGFLRDFRSLVQIVGRAARNKNGKVIFYASQETKDMKKAIEETERRRKIQFDFNVKNNLSPKSVKKDIKNVLLDSKVTILIKEFKNNSLSDEEKQKAIKNVEKLMKKAVKEFRFDKAIELRNLLFDLKSLI